MFFVFGHSSNTLVLRVLVSVYLGFLGIHFGVNSSLVISRVYDVIQSRAVALVFAARDSVHDVLIPTVATEHIVLPPTTCLCMLRVTSTECSLFFAFHVFVTTTTSEDKGSS